jgi:hypothetical protein
MTIGLPGVVFYLLFTLVERTRLIRFCAGWLVAIETSS